MIKAIAIDDEPLALKVVENFCQGVDFIDLQKTFTKPTEALKYLERYPVDLLFLDINMPSLSGLEFYRQLKQQTMVIFTTAHFEYAVEGFNLNAIDYLLKPYTPERFSQAVNKAKEFFGYQHQTDNTQPFFFIRADYSLIKINYADILFIEGLDDYLKIHLQNQKAVVARMTMKAVMEKLPQKEFVRVHRSYIIPLSKIESVRNKVIHIGEREFSIGSSYEENFFSMFKV
jgi:DNA-binding LytR/AlgR family response regulator